MSSSSLDYISVKGFKSITSIEKLPLRSVNISIGSKVRESRIHGALDSAWRLRRATSRLQSKMRGRKGTFLRVQGHQADLAFLFRLWKSQVNQIFDYSSPTQDDGLYPFSESAFFWERVWVRATWDEALALREQGVKQVSATQIDETLAGSGASRWLEALPAWHEHVFSNAQDCKGKRQNYSA